MRLTHFYRNVEKENTEKPGNLKVRYKKGSTEEKQLRSNRFLKIYFYLQNVKCTFNAQRLLFTQFYFEVELKL